MKIGAIQPQLPARRQAEQHPKPSAQVVERSAPGDQRSQAAANLAINELARPVFSVGRQRAIDFYVITEAISRPNAEGGDLIGIDIYT
ncbi:MAG: hypothetical protein ACI8PP_000032 [Candidatus Pseudothioglobus sp.]